MKSNIPIKMDLTPIENGVFEWTIHYNIVPIPYVSILVATIKSALAGDEDKLNQIMQENGVQGSATFISRTVELNWVIPYVSVSGFTLKYEVAFTTPLGTSIAAAPIAAAYVAWIAATIIAVLAYLVITNITSYLKSISPKEFTPRVPEDCPKNYSYDTERNKCIYTPPSPPDWLMYIAIAPFVLGGAYLVIKLYQERRK